MILTGSSLACKRGENLVFSEINFEIDTGTTCFVKGPNGSGKSTLLRLIAGFLRAEAGHLILDKLDITHNREIRTENFLYLGHQNVLKDHFTVMEQMSFWQGIFKQNYNFEFDPMNIHTILNKKLYQCSEGQRKRVALTRLTIEKKKFWLLDEPLSSLDNNSIKLFKDSLWKHCEKGGSAIIATHEEIKIKPSFKIHLSLEKSLLKKDDPFI